MILERKKIMELVERGALFYVSHSGGKDSQAMYAALKIHVPDHQIVVVHADLGEVEHEGTQEHIRANISHELHVVRAVKTFFEMVERRAKSRPDVPSWPSSATRQCTSDLKRGPIHKFIRNDMKARGALLALNCTGIRAEESPARSKKEPLKLNRALSKAGREVYEYMPIHHLTTKQIFWIIKNAGQEPFHIYMDTTEHKGNDRMSCVFCIMANKNDLRNGARWRPELLQKISDLEAKTGWTFFQTETLAEKIAA
jgi:3'-phosphoadenosine 5'-phosphosulfate sulfotransferase (PAPS reductase)/FAD synthetase